MFSETRYALNGDLRVAYRASREGPREIVFVPNWFTCCEILPELPSTQGWVEAMTSLGRLIFFDQPGTGASDPVTPGALPTLEQWADSITAVLDDLGSGEAVLLASIGAFATAALFAATHPSRTTALVVFDGYAEAGGTAFVRDEVQAATVRGLAARRSVRAHVARISSFHGMSGLSRSWSCPVPHMASIAARTPSPTNSVRSPASA